MDSRIIALLVAALAAGCDDTAPDPDSGEDLTPPTISMLVVNPPQAGAGQDVEITFEVNEPLSKAEIVVAGNPGGCVLAPERIVCGYRSRGDELEGRQSIKVRAADLAGNASEALAELLLDFQAPWVTFTRAPEAVTNQSAPVFEFGANETARFSCAADDAPAVRCVSPVSSARLADGPHRFTVEATDEVGNGTTSTISFTVDTVAPETVLDSSPPALSSLSLLVFEISSDDPSARFECSFDGSEPRGCVSPVEIDSVAEGAHSFVARAVDPAGNRDLSPVIVEPVVDRTAPVTIVDPIPNTGGPEREISFRCEDPEAVFECALDRNVFHPCVSPVQLTGIPDGKHVFWVRARDLAGNREEPDASGTFMVDTRGPIARIVSGPPALALQASATFDLAADEDPATFECSVDGLGFAPCSSHWAVSVVGDPLHTFEAVAIDRYGNRSPTPASYQWSTDAFPPTVRFVSAPPSLDDQRDGTLAFEANKPGCSLQCSLDGGPLLDCAGQSSYSGLADGPHVFSALATDSKGRTGSAEVRWTVDASAPSVSFRAAPPAISNVVPAGFELEASEPGCAFECALDTGSFEPCAATFSLTVGEGSHRLTARAVDPAGNVGSGSAHVFTIDLTPPAPPEIDQPDPSLVANTTPTLSWSPSATAVSYQVELAATEDFSPLVGNAEGTSLFFIPTPLASGRYYFRARARDEAGNDSPWSSSGIIEVRTWAFLNPRPTGATLLAADCADGERCWMVGEAGTALRTEDGGETFLQASTGVTGSLAALRMLDESTGVAVGEDGAIVRTTDGGITWRPVASGTRSDLYAVRFRGDVGFAAGASGLVLRSADRGLTWSRLPTPTSASLRALAILDAGAQTVVAVGGSGTVIRTVDGGLGWTEPPSGATAQLRALSFVDARVGFAAGASGVLLETTDGGLSWGSVETGGSQSLHGAHFVSASVGYVLGDSTTAYASIRRTADGGRTWSDVVTPPGASMRAMAPAGAGALLAVGEGGTVLRSAGGGTSFPAVAGCSGGPTQTLYQELRALQMLTPQVGYVFGGRGFAMRTDDGGATLEPLAPEVFTETKELYAASFFSSSGGWVGGNSGFLARTSDGQSFATVAMPAGVSFSVRALSFVDAEHGLIVGTQGKVLAWSSASLHEVPSPTAASLRAVRLTSSSSGLIAGDDGTLLRYQAPSLVPEASGVTADLNGLWAFDDTNAFAVGASGTVLRRDATGWSRVASGTSAGLEAIAFSDRDHGWIVGDGLILATSDGGATWVRQVSPTGSALRALSAPSATTVFAAGDARSLVRSTVGGR